MVVDKNMVYSGTVNLPMAISMVRAIKNAVDQTKELNLRLSNYKINYFHFLAEYKNVFINSPQNASPHIINIGFPGVRVRYLLIMLFQTKRNGFNYKCLFF